MSKSIVDVGNEFFPHLKFDSNLYKRIREYRIKWAQKDDDYIEFLGGNLIGVHPIRFSTLDEENFFIDLLNVDQTDLKNAFYKLDGIDETFKVTSNTLYLTLIYLMHKFMSSKEITSHKNDVLRELYYIFAYKVTSSLISHYFKYPLDESKAKVVYEKLSNRFLIKRLGSWQKVFEYRSNDIIPPSGLHAHKLHNLTTDDCVKIIADMQGRLREGFKNIFSIVVEVNNANEKIYSSSMIVEDEEGESTRDITGRPDKYIGYMYTIVNSPNDFINDDLVYLVSHFIPSLDKDKFVETLKYISNNIHIKPSDDNDFINTSIQTTINYLRTKNIVNNYEKNAHSIITSMRGYWSSSSVKDPNIKQMKEYLNKITQIATGKKTKWLLSTIVIGILIYIFIRSLYKNK